MTTVTKTVASMRVSEARRRVPVVPLFYDVEDTATALGMSPNYVGRLIRRGVLPSRKIGSLRRIPVSAIEQLARECTPRAND